MATWTWFHRFGSPPWVYGFGTRWAPWFGVAAVVMMLIALYGGLVLAPPDYQQKDAFRIVYIHAPVATLSMAVYSTMAVAAAVGLIWRIKVAHAAAVACAPIGAWFTVATLGTGMLWGKPLGGAVWVGAARRRRPAGRWARGRRLRPRLWGGKRGGGLLGGGGPRPPRRLPPKNAGAE